jgi:hypothetical protein
MTAQDLITQALTLIGRLGAGRGPGIAESNVSFQILNNMLDSWSTKRLNVYAIAQQTFSLTPAQEQYTIGPGGSGQWNTARPIAIESADAFLFFQGASQASYFPLKVLSQKEYAQIETLGDQSYVPKSLYCDYAYPSSNLYVYPAPAIACSLELYTWTPLQQFSSLSTALSMPNGYPRAIAYNLAVELAPIFEKPVPEAVLAIAKASKESIQGINARLAPVDETAAEEAEESDRGNKQ